MASLSSCAPPRADVRHQGPGNALFVVLKKLQGVVGATLGICGVERTRDSPPRLAMPLAAAALELCGVIARPVGTLSEKILFRQFRTGTRLRSVQCQVSRRHGVVVDKAEMSIAE